ncbi:MAG: polysaccharide biosynthesis tyrosine autokinase [Sedimentisphaerales bacterium]|nr:polysaccharide biosynthesis tyrosine autokinase [Sedimentisphaerales bacterium]
MPNDQSEIEEIYQQTSLRDLFDILLKHKRKMIVFFTVVVIGVSVLILFSADIYRSEATLLVRLGRESVALDPTVTTGQIVPVQRSRESEILTELDILRSRRLAEKVVDLMGPDAILKGVAERTAEETSEQPSCVAQTNRNSKRRLRSILKWVGLGGGLSDRDKAVLDLMKNSEIDTEKKISDTINVYFEAKDPNSAQHVLARLIDAYLEEHAAVHEASGSYEFFVQQSKMARDNLSRLEKQLQDLRKGSSMSLLNEELKITLNRIGSLESEIDREEASLGAARAGAQELAETLEGLPETVVTSVTTGVANMAADKMRERLYELQLKEQDLLSKYDEQTRQVREIRRQVAEAQAVLEKEKRVGTETTTGFNTARQQTELSLLTERASISALEMRITCLKQKLAQAQTQLQNLNDKAAKMKSLNREIEIQEGNYLKYAKNLEQARIDQALMADRISNITIVQPATLPIKPVGPRKGLQFFFGLFLGVSGAVALAFVWEYLGRTIQVSREKQADRRVPVLAYLPHTHENTICPIGYDSRFSEDDDNVSEFEFGEWDIPDAVRSQYEMLGQKILSSWENNDEPRVLAIMPSHHSEKGNPVSANLAVVLSRCDKGPVLLVDANFTSPSLHRIFHVNASVGLLDIMSYEGDLSDFIWPLPLQNLSLLPAGTLRGNPSEIGDPSRITALLDRLKKDYHYIVIDIPPVDEADWAVRLAGECDGVGLVVEEGNANRETIRTVKEQLVMSKAKILGAVVNQKGGSVPIRPYGYYCDQAGIVGLN